MKDAQSQGSGNSRYELRFVNLFDSGRGFAFPCDAKGRVDLDALGERIRSNYLYARAVIGHELAPPVTCVVRESGETAQVQR